MTVRMTYPAWMDTVVSCVIEYMDIRDNYTQTFLYAPKKLMLLQVVLIEILLRIVRQPNSFANQILMFVELVQKRVAFVEVRFKLMPYIMVEKQIIL